MKDFSTIILAIALFSAVGPLNGQERYTCPPGLPLKEGNELHYGTDVTVNDAPDQNQRHADLTVAINGWLYAGYVDITPGTVQVKVFRSMTNGANWSDFITIDLQPTVEFRTLKLLATGSDPDQIKLLVGYMFHYPASTYDYIDVIRYNARTGAIEGPSISLSSINTLNDFALASDYRLPAQGAAPYSVGIVFSESMPKTDQIHFYCSSDGGISFPTHKVVRSTSGYAGKVDVAFGKSATMAAGRYFVAWEERVWPDDELGAIYTSYTYTGHDGDFTTPHRLDDMSPYLKGYCRNPSIACQFNAEDNDLFNLTALIMFERGKDGSSADCDILGFYNREAVFTLNWDVLSITLGPGQERQPDLSYDPDYMNFLLTYYDEANEKLPYAYKEVNLPDPNNWTLVTEGYNDDGVLSEPCPRVEINPVETQTAHIWVSEGMSGNGILLYDAEYSTVGTRNVGPSSALNVRVVPNPCNIVASFVITSGLTGNLTLMVHNSLGQMVKVASNLPVIQGVNEVSLDLSAMPAGCYYYKATAGNHTVTGKLIVSGSVR